MNPILTQTPDFSEDYQPENTDHSKWPVGIRSILQEINVDFLNKITYEGTIRCLAYLRTIGLQFSLSKRRTSLQDSDQQIDIPDAKMKSR